MRTALLWLSILLAWGATVASAASREPLVPESPPTRASADLAGYVERDYRSFAWVVPDGSGEPRERLVAWIRGELGRLEGRLALAPPQPIRIVEAPARVEFERVIGLLGGGRPAPWAVAIAFPARGYVVLDAARRGWGAPLSYGETVSHELVHVLIGAPPTIPRWAHEGFAQRLSGATLGNESASELAAWAHRDELVALADLDRYLNPQLHHRAGIFYRQALSFMTYLESRCGPSVHGRVIAAVRGGQTFPEAIAAVAGTSLDALEADWRTQLASQFSILAYLGGLLRPFSLIALGCAAGYFFQRRRRRRALDRMAREESAEEERTGFDGDV